MEKNPNAKTNQNVKKKKKKGIEKVETRSEIDLFPASSFFDGTMRDGGIPFHVFVDFSLNSSVKVLACVRQ